MVNNGKEFAKKALLGISVIILTPMLVGLISGLLGGTLSFLTAQLFLGISVLSILAAGTVAYLVDMGIQKYWR